jgi:WD40 repeat protein
VFYPEDDRLMFITEQEEVEVWRMASDQNVSSFGRGEVGQDSTSPALSADGAWFAVGGNRQVPVWHTESKKRLLALPTARSAARSLAWSPNQELLAVGTATGGLVIWNIPRIRSQLGEVGLDW